MPIGSHIQTWRLSRGLSVPAVAAKAGLPARLLEAIECGELDPSASTLETLASALGVPTSWLFGDPKHLDLLTAEDDGDVSDLPSTDAVDPVMERILVSALQERELYV
ncbi:MAG: helix-turn-helix domain-containing protein, partial [Nitrospiraceae bacterium]